MADEPKIEEQDTLSPIEELQKRMEDIEMSLGVFNPRNLGGLRTKDLQQATRANLFGDGSDGDVVVSTSIDLTRDMFYNSLTVEAAGIINTKSFRIFVKDQFIKKPGGIVRNNGNAGDNGGDYINTFGPIPGGAAVAAGSLPGGVAGSVGGTGSNPGNAGTVGVGTDKSLGSAGSGGGGGGAGISYPGGAGGSGGSQTGTIFNFPNSFSSAYYLIDILPSIVALTLSAGSGGGGGGAGTTKVGGGRDVNNGGGAGSTGGMLWIASNRIFVEGVDEIQCQGGAGGDGGDGEVAASHGAGGGGAGGSGGVLILIYGEKTGTGTLSVAGGAGGIGGTGLNNGVNGGVGQTGKQYLIQIA